MGTLFCTQCHRCIGHNDTLPTGAHGLCGDCRTTEAFVTRCAVPAVEPARVREYARWLFSATEPDTAQRIIEVEHEISLRVGRDMFGYVSKLYFGLHDERTRE